MIPGSLIKIRSCALKARKNVIDRYNALRAEPEVPAYLLERDMVRSHMERSVEEINYGGLSPKTGRLVYTRSMAGGCAFNPEGGALTEVSIGAMAKLLCVKGELQVAAGFFSSMVASIDDYLDREGSYDIYGERLFYISHAYRDLVDLALETELERGALSRGSLLETKKRLFEVTSTLAASENASTAEDYLYKKSCGDKVIEVLFPSSNAGGRLKGLCREIGRLVGEAGQLIDDMIDYDYDRAAGKKNYIIMTGRNLDGALKLIVSRVERAKALARETDSKAVSWILETLSGIADIFARELESGRRVEGTLLEGPLRPLLPRVPRNQFFIWF